MVIVKITPALGLAKMSDSALDTYCGERIADLTLHGDDFPGLSPTVAAVTTQRGKYRNALDNLRRGDKSSTTTKNNERSMLELLLTTQADNCAEIAGEDIAKYQRSGYGMKAKSQPTDQLLAPANVSVELGPGEGQLYVRFKGVENAHNYEIWYGKSSVNPENWTDHVSASSGRKTLLNELESNVEYGVRIRATGGNNLVGNWTTVIVKKTY